MTKLPRRLLGHVFRAMAYETVVVLITAVSVAVLLYAGLQGRFSDLYLRARGPAPLSGEVALVPIDDEALYLWDPTTPPPEITPRALLAQLIDVATAAGARVVVLDVLLDRPAPGDDALARAARAHGGVISAERFVATDPASEPFAAGPTTTLGDAVGGAPANLMEEEGRLLSGSLQVRGLPLLTAISRARLGAPFPGGLVGGVQAEGEVAPSLPLAAAWLQRARQRDPAARLSDLRQILQQGCAVTPATGLRCTLSAADLDLPPLPVALHEHLDLNFRGPEGGDGLPSVPAARLLRIAAATALARQVGAELPLQVPPEVADKLAGKVVLIGRIDEAAAHDRFVTPYSFPLLLSADMAGLRIQAQAVDTLLSGHHLRKLSRGWSWLLGLVLAAAVLLSHRRLSDGVHGLLWLAVSVDLVLAGALLFAWTDGVVLQLDPPLLFTLGALLCTHFLSWVRHDLPATDPEPSP